MAGCVSVPGGLLKGDGTIIAEELVIAGSGDNQFFGGLVQPGNSPGKLTIQGNFTQELGGRLIVEAAGVAAGSSTCSTSPETAR
jgi:hypothetical protein